MSYPKYGGLTAAQASIVDSIPATGFGDFEVEPAQAITDTPAIVNNWTVNNNVNIVYNSGRFTLSEAGFYAMIIGQVVSNLDLLPSVNVDVTIDFRVNGISAFTQTLPVAKAVSSGVASVLNYSRGFNRAFDAGDYIEFYISGIDGVLAPANCSLSLLRFTANLIHKLA